jgi:hypothetical protein
MARFGLMCIFIGLTVSTAFAAETTAQPPTISHYRCFPTSDSIDPKLDVCVGADANVAHCVRPLPESKCVYENGDVMSYTACLARECAAAVKALCNQGYKRLLPTAYGLPADCA